LVFRARNAAVTGYDGQSGKHSGAGAGSIKWSLGFAKAAHIDAALRSAAHPKIPEGAAKAGGQNAPLATSARRAARGGSAAAFDSTIHPSWCFADESRHLSMRRTKGFLRVAARFDSTAGRLSLRRVVTRQLEHQTARHLGLENMERNMWKMTVAAALALSAVATSNPAQSQGYGIHIFESSYGLPGRATQVTGLVAARCEGTSFSAAIPPSAQESKWLCTGPAAAAATAPLFQNTLKRHCLADDDRSEFMAGKAAKGEGR